MRNLYYTLKPILPRGIRIGLRQIRAGLKRKLHRHDWPICETAATPPANWPGWPDGKKFAFILTHDVEGPAGVAKCRQLMELERSMGFHSSFNFVPEGTYALPKELRDELTSNGFEIGVHDLHHDGKLFRSRKNFATDAQTINRYLKEWGAVGFRAGFMLRQLDWYHDLEIQYDASTFDTDPFEPMPDGARTIFPFWIKAPVTSTDSNRQSQRKGYTELPYSLPQDSTLFFILRETTPSIWLNKLDWVAQHGGMALVNVHPDYLRFPGEPARPDTFPVEHYIALLERVRSHHGAAVWHALPRDAAALVAQN